MTAFSSMVFGMIAMVPVLFAGAGYVLVSSGGTDEHKGYRSGK
ncbi:hypothetical protein [Mycolicibacterium moriokaense]|jgi:hypothetical protein|nr:hypothetical protein [Mycolicibacterium moriokaense]